MADPEIPGTFHVHTHSSGAEYWRSVIEIAAFIVAAAWAFYVFIYQEQIKPANTAPQGEVTVGLTHRSVASGSEFVSVNLEFHNIGTVRFRPAGFVVNAYGYRYLPRIVQTVTKSMTRNIITLDRSLAETRPVLLQSTYAKWANFGSGRTPASVPPGARYKVTVAFGIPRDAYDVIFLKYKYCIAWYGNTKVYNPGLYRDVQGAYWFGYVNFDATLPMVCGQASRVEFPL